MSWATRYREQAQVHRRLGHVRAAEGSGSVALFHLDAADIYEDLAADFERWLAEDRRRHLQRDFLKLRGRIIGPKRRVTTDGVEGYPFELDPPVSTGFFAGEPVISTSPVTIFVLAEAVPDEIAANLCFTEA